MHITPFLEDYFENFLCIKIRSCNAVDSKLIDVTDPYLNLKHMINNYVINYKQ